MPGPDGFLWREQASFEPTGECSASSLLKLQSPSMGRVPGPDPRMARYPIRSNWGSHCHMGVDPFGIWNR
ncbi:hypothetical protein PVAG01_00561 [Phlyctema vagabunda]|uniref:Uncharacterized protein n=1 Tax=Phlyctema vagabunda TaxID=108571 RepID=A0ABR4PUJ8_9HELO